MELRLAGNDAPNVSIRIRCGGCHRRRRPAPIMAWMTTRLDVAVSRGVPKGRWTMSLVSQMQGTETDTGAPIRRLLPVEGPVGRAVELHCRGCGARPRKRRARLFADADDLRASTLAGERVPVEGGGFLTLYVT